MTIRIFTAICLFVILSCNNAKKINPSTDTKRMEQRANDLYMSNNYSTAILTYDTLISIDSTKGEYYFKRGYSKTMTSTDNTAALADYFKAIAHNYDNKAKVYSNIGALHRANAVFHCSTNSERIVEYNTALYFYNESLNIDPSY